MKIRIADLNVEIHNRYPYLENLCRDYLAEFETADITVTVTPDQIAKEQAAAQGKTPPSPGYAEGICAYRAVAMELPRFSAFVFHAAVVEHKGVAYAFSAQSGTGKTTHVRLWLKAFGEQAAVINGDKPILRFFGDTLYAYGTPWCGKEGMQINRRAPLRALCFLERAPENSICPIDDADAVHRLFSQVVMPSGRSEVILFLDLLDQTVKNLPTYLLSCNMQQEAALVALNGMSKGEQYDSQ